jgi:hypothetical protein
MEAMMKVYKGAIITCDDKNTVAKYLVEDGGRIVYVGDDLPAQYASAKKMSLGKRALIPAFTDSHIHFASFATFHAGLNVMHAKSNAQILEMLKVHAAATKEKIVIGFGASPYSVVDGRLVNREELDSVCPDKPVFMVKYDGHACVINTKLLEKVRQKVSGLRGYHEDTGEMNQEAFFAVSDYITNAIPVLKLVENMQKAVDYMASKGIGMIHTVSGVGFTGDLDVDLERWFGQGLDNGMQLRVFFQTMDVSKAVKRHLPRLGGCFATALDGCFGSRDAALLEPYANSDSTGVLYYTDEQVIAFCKEANRAGLQIEMHAIGDAAFRQATKAIKAALDDYPREDHRHAIIHACLPTQEGLDICEKYHILLPVQSAFINWPQEPDSYLAEILGERSNRLNPLRDFCDRGLVLSAGSDGPCTDPDPIEWIHRACNHSVPEQSLSVYEALRMCTYNGYYTTFDEKERGSLEAGKIADMVILSENPYEIDVQNLKEIQVERLLLQGKPYQKVNKNVIVQLVKGMVRKQK